MRCWSCSGFAETGYLNLCLRYSWSVAAYSVVGFGVVAISNAALGSNKSMQPTCEDARG